MKRQITDQQEKLEDQENRSRRDNIHIRGLPETYKNLDRDIPALLSLLAPHLSSDRLELDRVHWSLGKPAITNQPRDIIAKFQYFQTKETIMKAARETDPLQFEGHPIQIFVDLAPQTIQRRRTFKPALTILQSHNIKYRWSFPLRLNFTYSGKQYLLQ
ncbi:hypothetical protein XENTR_v10013917 [Xenopus tropicalis]|nr:hypothetical protein XENTR_v10013917 [Xenopus tropicalis]